MPLRSLPPPFSPPPRPPAAQATEPTSLIPLTRGSPQAVLVGDHRQLGPLVAGRQAKDMGLEVPLFERLQAAGACVGAPRPRGI